MLDGSVDLNLLRTFLLVCQEGSLAKAAPKLFLTEPSLSVRVRRLEKQLGFTLFERTARGMRLTPSGDLLRSSVATTLSSLETAIREARDAGAQTHVRVTLGSTPITLGHLLPGILTRLAVVNPQLEITVRGAPSVEVTADLLGGRVDCGIVGDFEPPRLAGFQADLLLHDVIGLVVPPGHPLDSSEPLHAGELRGHRLLSYDRTRGYWPLVERVLVRGGLHPSEMYRVESREGIVELVKGNLGAAFSPGLQVLEELERGDLIFRPLELGDGRKLEFLTWICYDRSHRLAPFLTELAQVVGESSEPVQRRLDVALGRARPGCWSRRPECSGSDRLDLSLPIDGASFSGDRLRAYTRRKSMPGALHGIRPLLQRRARQSYRGGHLRRGPVRAAGGGQARVP